MLNSQSKPIQINNNLLKDLILYFGSFCLFLYIHLPLTLRFGYDCDEILDFKGTSIARDVYLAFGRWGIVLWGYLVGDGLKPWSGGITAGLILCFALLIQTKVLFSENTQLKLKAFYCVLYLATGQFAYTLTYSMQTEAFALSILFTSLACFVTFYNQNKIKLQRAIYATFLLYIALSFYQTSGLLFYSLFCFCLLNRSSKQLLNNLFILGIICITAIILAELTKKAIITYKLPTPDAIEFTQCHLSHSLSTGIVYTQASILHLLKKLFLCTIACNIRIQIVFFIALAFITYKFIKSKFYKKLGIVFIATTAPYFILLFMEPSSRMFLFLPAIASYIIVIFISHISCNQLLKYAGYSLLAIFCISASHKVSLQSLTERTRHDYNLLVRFAQYHEAKKIMIRSQKPKAKILVFEIGWNDKAPDFYHAYPFQNFHLGTYKDREKHQDVLAKMPSWPAEGSVMINQEDIIIKSGIHW